MESKEIEKRIEESKKKFQSMGLNENQIEILLNQEREEIKEKLIDSIESEKTSLLKKLEEIKSKEKSLGIRKSRGMKGGNKNQNINYFEIEESKEKIIPNSILHIFHEINEGFSPRGISIKSIESMMERFGIKGKMIILPNNDKSKNIQRIRFSESKYYKSKMKKIRESEDFKFFRMNLKNKENIRFKDFGGTLELE
ncbi:MAG: hypothetical protein ACXADB_05355 [Candidatus Hermodarchaeia archaeon]|jgi:hypothetical protein